MCCPKAQLPHLMYCPPCLLCISWLLLETPETPPFFPAFSLHQNSCLVIGQSALLTNESNTYSQCTKGLFHSKLRIYDFTIIIFSLGHRGFFSILNLRSVRPCLNAYNVNMPITRGICIYINTQQV